jgi:hypothetical protein
MNTLNTKTPEELQKEVQQDILIVRTDIDQIQRRLRPGQLMADVILRSSSLIGNVTHLKRKTIVNIFLVLKKMLLSNASFGKKIWGKLNSARSLVIKKLKFSKADIGDRVKRKFKQATQLVKGGETRGVKSRPGLHLGFNKTESTADELR